MEPTLRNWVRRLGTLRFLNVLLGVWLVLSAFILPHTFDEAMVAWILGALIALSSATSFVAHEISYIDAIFAVLLGASALVLSKAPAVTRINEGGIALARPGPLDSSEQTRQRSFPPLPRGSLTRAP